MILNVAYSSDDNYARYLGISMLSMLENNYSDFAKIRIFIINNGISPENIARINFIAEKYRADICVVELEKLCPDLNTDGTFSRSSFGRIFLSRLSGIDKILYLDSDSIVCGSFKELYRLNLDECYVAGVQDNVYPFFKEWIGLPSNARYINAGFMLMNLKLWRKDGVERKCLTMIEKFHGSVPHHDQGVINYVCRGKIKYLHPKYNLQPPMVYLNSKQIKLISLDEEYYKDDEIRESRDNPIFIHFTTDILNRPWFVPTYHPDATAFYKYMNMSPWFDVRANKKLPTKARVMRGIYTFSPFIYLRLVIPLVRLEKRYRLKKRLRLKK